MKHARDFGLSRRGFCLCCIGAASLGASGTWLTPGEVFAQSRNIVDSIRSAAADASITIHKLRGETSVLQGSGGNIAVLAGSDGKLLVDAGITASRRSIQEALASLGKEPVRHLVNTHWHFDHTDGNEWLHEQGVSIVAHDNTRKRLAVAQRVEDWDFTFPQSPNAALPTTTFTQEMNLSLNRVSVTLRYYGPAHTDGDISVFFQQSNILHTGDTYWNGFYPFIDYSTSGSIDGIIQATEANLATATEDTMIIPGHGHPVSNKRELAHYRDMLVDVRDAVASLKRQGRTLVEAVAAKPTAAFDAKWGRFAVTPELFVRLVYAGV